MIYRTTYIIDQKEIMKYQKGYPYMKNNKEYNKKVTIEYLYLDLNTCDRCIGTDQILDEIIETITPTLKLAGYEIQYNKIEMKTEKTAREFKFLSSPTIRVNGRDICTSVKENSCGCCSDISGTDVDCRVFEYNGKTYEIPPKEMLAYDILNNIFGKNKHESSLNSSYELPENLKEFYKGKRDKEIGK